MAASSHRFALSSPTSTPGIGSVPIPQSTFSAEWVCARPISPISGCLSSPTEARKFPWHRMASRWRIPAFPRLCEVLTRHHLRKMRQLQEVCVDWTVQVAADRGKLPGIRPLSHRCEAKMANLAEFTAAADACLVSRLTFVSSCESEGSRTLPRRRASIFPEPIGQPPEEAMIPYGSVVT